MTAHIFIVVCIKYSNTDSVSDVASLEVEQPMEIL
jgi:hypothetical protein